MLEEAVAARKYPADPIDWPIDYDEPDPEDRARLIREEEERRAAFGGFLLDDDVAGIPRAPQGRAVKLKKRPTNPIGPRQEDWVSVWIRPQDPNYRPPVGGYAWYNQNQSKMFQTPADPLVLPTKWFNGVPVPFITNKQLYAAVAGRLKRLLKVAGKGFTEDKPPYKLGYFLYDYEGERLKLDEKFWTVPTPTTTPIPYNDDPFVPARNMQLTIDFEAKVFADAFDREEACRSTRHTSLNSEAPGSEISLDSCIDRFEAEEVLDGDNKLYCSRCKEHRPTKRSMQLWRVPDVLVLHFKRFQFANNAGELGLVLRGKIHSLVKFPTQGLDLSGHLKGQSVVAGDAVYDLFAVSHHHGMAGYGHYTAHGLHEPTGKWYRFDDDRVHLAKEDDCVAASAYVLFYKKRGVSDEAAAAEVTARMGGLSIGPTVPVAATGGGSSAAAGAAGILSPSSVASAASIGPSSSASTVSAVTASASGEPEAPYSATGVQRGNSDVEMSDGEPNF